MCKRVGEDFSTWLVKCYWNEEMNSREIAEIAYGKRKNGPNITGWMEKLGIERRSRSEAVALQWEDNDGRRMWQSNFAKVHLSCGTPARENLIKTMQTEEYRKKSSVVKLGDKNPMWKREKTDEERTKEKIHSRRLPGYKDFRRSVYARDNYTCQICEDSKGGNLVVHHLNGFHWDVNNRVEVDNGVTLCVACHKEFHKIYGRENINLFQFSQFKDYKTMQASND